MVSGKPDINIIVEGCMEAMDVQRCAGWLMNSTVKDLSSYSRSQGNQGEGGGTEVLWVLKPSLSCPVRTHQPCRGLPNYEAGHWWRDRSRGTCGLSSRPGQWVRRYP